MPDGFGAHEFRVIGWAACIAHRGAYRPGLSFGADLGVIFDIFIMMIASSDVMKKIMTWLGIDIDIDARSIHMVVMVEPYLILEQDSMVHLTSRA